MNGWTKVLTNPLGLAGYALFLVFGLLGKPKKNDPNKWRVPVAMVMAATTLAGCLYLSYLHETKSSAPNQQAQPQVQLNNQVLQNTTGPGSPAVQGVQGDVHITVDQSKGESDTSNTVKNAPQKSK